MLCVRDHGFRAHKICPRQIAVAVSAGSIAERRAFTDFVGAVHLDLQSFDTMFHGGFHIFRTPFETGIERIDRTRPFVHADAVEHFACRKGESTAVETGRRLHMDAVFPAEFSPAGEQIIRHF